MQLTTRRNFFTQSGAGFAGVALGALLTENSSTATINPLYPLAERLPQIAPRARQVIFLFQYGGPWKWSRHGETGRWFSDLLPHTARHADQLCIVRSMFSDSSNHAPETYLMNTGAILGGRPSLGSWVTYGLGSANQNLPDYVLLYQVGGLGGSAN